jgi:predicted dehydrogenase
MNWGCYDLDYLLGLTGWSLQPETVLAQTWTIPPQFEGHIAPNSDAETYVTALIRCAGGTVISYERGEYMPAATDEAWAIVGTAGSLRLQMTPGVDKVIWHDAGTSEAGLTSRPLWQGSETYDTVHPGPLRDFAQAIRQNRPPQTSLERALVVQQLTDAIYASAASGAVVRLEGDHR